jgi:hypothetical protein
LTTARRGKKNHIVTTIIHKVMDVLLGDDINQKTPTATTTTTTVTGGTGIKLPV